MKKTILVTGGTGVIGLSIIEFFYKKGFNVIAAGISKANNTKIFKKKFSPKRSLTINTELTSSKSVKKVIASSIKKFKKIDALVNCAGIQFVMPIDEYPEKVWRKMMVFQYNSLLATRRSLPSMRQQYHGAAIVNIASTTPRVLNGSSRTLLTQLLSTDWLD